MGEVSLGSICTPARVVSDAKTLGKKHMTASEGSLLWGKRWQGSISAGPWSGPSKSGEAGFSIGYTSSSFVLALG